MKTLCINLVVLVTLLMHSTNTQSQSLTVDYVDITGNKTSKDSASFRVESEVRGNYYYRNFYSTETGKLDSKGLYRDTTMWKPVGMHYDYYASGSLKDSSYYDDSSTKIKATHYYESGKMFIKYEFNTSSEEESVIAFEESGNVIPNFIYEREADFPGGIEGWKKHLFKNLNADVPIKKRAKDGLYKVIIRFIVEKDGSLSNLQAETNFGRGMEQEALRVIRMSPKWLPAIRYNKPVRAYRRQPIAFVVTSE